MKYNLNNPMDKERFKARCNQLYKKGGVVELNKPKKKRSVDANALMWVYLNFIALETGNDSQDLHEAFKGMFLQSKTIDLGDRQETVKASTAKLDSQEFSLYLEKVKIFAADELGVYLPSREDALFDEFYMQYG